MTTTVTAGPIRAARGRRSPRARRLRSALVGFAFVAPLLIGLGVFHLYPMVLSLYASFTNWNGLTSPRWIGAQNYVRLLVSDPLFFTVVRNTLLFMCGAIPLTMVIALLLAALMSAQRRPMAFYRLAFFIPYVANSVAVSVVWFRLYSGTDGLINAALGAIGIHGPDWLVQQPWPLIAVIVTSTWQGLGYPMIVLIGGIQAIPASLYEAAAIDGAGRWRQFWSVTLPMLTPSLFFVSISQFIASFQVFGIVYVMTKGGPGSATLVYLMYLFNTAFGTGKLGYASAMAWLLFVIIAVLTMVQWRLQRRWVFYE